MATTTLAVTNHETPESIANTEETFWNNCNPDISSLPTWQWKTNELKMHFKKKTVSFREGNFHPHKYVKKTHAQELSTC